MDSSKIVIDNLINVCYESERGFREAFRMFRSPALRTLALCCADERKEFIRGLALQNSIAGLRADDRRRLTNTRSEDPLPVVKLQTVKLLRDVKSWASETLLSTERPWMNIWRQNCAASFNDN